MNPAIDFQEAKERLNSPKSATEDLTAAVETFAFSRLPDQHRVALILAGMFGGDAETYLERAGELMIYAASNFSIPYKAKV